MSSLADAVTLLGNLGVFTIIVPAILIFALMYGILSKTELFGKSPAINAIISIAAALLVISFLALGKFIQYLMPAITIILVIMLVIFLIFRFAGVEAGTITNAIKGNILGYGIIVAVVLIMVFMALFYAFPEMTQTNVVPRPGEAKTAVGGIKVIEGNFTGKEMIPIETVVQYQSGKALLNPTVIAALVMLLTFVIAAYMIVRN